MSTSIQPQITEVTIAVVFGGVAVLVSLFAYLFSKPSFPENAPPLTKDAYPIIGSFQFFTERWDFFKRAITDSPTGNFSFYAGKHPVIGVSGPYARKLFFDSKDMSFGDGYAALLAGAPPVKEDINPSDADRNVEDFSSHFAKRLTNMVKGPQLKKGLPYLLQDARKNLDQLAAEPEGITDPFDSIYRIVFQLTMRTVACKDIAEDPALLDQCLSHFEAVEMASTPWAIMYPWMPSLSQAKRTYGGAQLYIIFKRIVDARQNEGLREDDPLQYLMDLGDSIKDIITFVIGALFAGQLNSGINAAWILIYLAHNRYWFDRVREEVISVADRYCSDSSLPLKERLMQVPIEAWENDFELIDLCLKDTIRVQTPGTAFRKNISGHDIPLNKQGTEVIPKDAYLAYAVGDVHYDPALYPDPEKWDPSRYLPERAEDKKIPYGWMGWGLGRHPCAGQRFAKLENNVIVAFFLAYFDDVKVVDKTGKPISKLPSAERNNSSAQKPTKRVYLKYKVAA
ncbi:hypothetical protein BAUCODRAFT_216247 [Baudoinia panamericana UAMH 10762]|uniref:Cytochrome P450 n=1 Tax=Baudoinia panamericana (strain UAMH 10762) TaxID=717646 RepID=M2LIG6_BAUPA|nr:uncharacterized protein BAUCODRAFT_216247 [Baudoinia panamericana UAMH 10762]EMC93962.1 hypothetical protein BAUCODRAFT_216247 [Baudoinia panamericana UAMH 10762]